MCLNVFIILQLFRYGFRFSDAWKCVRADYSDTEKYAFLLHFYWLGLAIRFIELSETLIFVLRKKQSQVSFLHVYHHLGTPTIAWIFIKYNSGLMEAMFLALNSAVHVLMYTYYFLSSFKSLTKYLQPVKPLITIVQLVQFIVLMGQCVAALRCGESKLFLIAIALMMILFALFVNFFIQSYSLKKSKSK